MGYFQDIRRIIQVKYENSLRNILLLLAPSLSLYIVLQYDIRLYM